MAGSARPVPKAPAGFYLRNAPRSAAGNTAAESGCRNRATPAGSYRADAPAIPRAEPRHPGGIAICGSATDSEAGGQTSYGDFWIGLHQAKNCRPPLAEFFIRLFIQPSTSRRDHPASHRRQILRSEGELDPQVVGFIAHKQLGRACVAAGLENPLNTAAPGLDFTGVSGIFEIALFTRDATTLRDDPHCENS